MKQFAWFCLWIFISGVFCARTVDVQSGESGIIPCDLAGTFQYPTWRGPEGLTNPLNNGQQINEKSIQWANNGKDLMISNSSIRYNGDYTCSYGGNSASVTLNVLYFEAPTVFYDKYLNKSDPLVMMCSVYSNPNSLLSWTVPKEFDLGTQKTPTLCGVDKTINKVKCESTLRFEINLVSKDDNGKNVTCNIDYLNRHTKIDTVLDVENPLPLDVILKDWNEPITKAGNVELTCNTNNVVRVLRWFRGKDYTYVERNERITAAHRAISEDPRLFIEKLMLNVNTSMNGERVFCCAWDVKSNTIAGCSSRLISLPTSSSIGHVGISSSKLLLIWCFLLMTWLRK